MTRTVTTGLWGIAIMIDETEFLKYKLEMERRFFELEKKVLILSHELEKHALGKPGAVTALTDDEKKKMEEDSLKQAKTFAEWTEDSETLERLGVGIKTNE